MDYQQELKRMNEGSNYWKPKPGQFKVKALSEIEDTDPFVKKKEDGTEDVNEQFKIKIEVNGEEKTWTFGKGKTAASTEFQLVDLAIKNGSKLTGVQFTVVVKSDGNKNDYTIIQ